MSPQSNEVADRNVERLLSAAYRPEVLDPGFIQETHDKLKAAAQEMAARWQNSKINERPAERDYTRVRRTLGWAMAAAAALACVFLVQRATRDRVAPRKGSDPKSIAKTPAPLKGATFAGRTPFGLSPRPRPEAPTVSALKVGAVVATRPGERRRFALEDGSILYVNSDSELRHVGPRRITLTRGEVYVEVAPREAGSEATFVVETPKRNVSALGTRFSVQADPQGAGVLVTQGKVQVSDLERPLATGEQLITGSTRIAAAPRATHELDWTKDLMVAAESPLVPGAEHCGGALLAIDPFGQEIRLSMRKYHIDVHIEDGFARTTIDQTYFNNETWRLEGTFYFPLPPDASLSRLAMYVEDGDSSKLNEGGMAERNHARNVYETILHQRRDPALLEWVDGSTFKMRVFPLEGRKEKRIILSYTQRLGSNYGITNYRFPTGHSMELVRDWSFHVRVKHGGELRITSPSHPDAMTIVSKGGDMLLDASAKNTKPEKDVVLEILDGTDDRELARFSGSVHEKHQYLMLRYRPELKMETKLQRRDWVILFEAGANRDPLLARTQIEVVKNLLDNAEHDDTFTLLTANTRVHFFDKKPRPLTPKNVAEAIAWLDTTHLIGALDLSQALSAAGPALKLGKNPHLVHVGAGVSALGERGDDVLARQIPVGVRYVGVGVGKKWNRAFMKLAAERSGGYFAQINPDESIVWKSFDLLATLNTPRLMDLRVVDADGKAAFLTESLALNQGEEVCAITRVEPAMGEKLPAKVIVTGKLDGKAFKRTLNVAETKPGADYLPRTWAKLEIDRLLADGAEKNKDAITKLSMASYVMSPFTSLLVLETEEDYKNFKVDRGRKDHWAMYPCPDRIPTVFEPDALRQAWILPKDAEGKQAPEHVLASILLRPTPRFLDLSRGERKHLSEWMTALQVYQMMYQSAYALPAPRLDFWSIELGELATRTEWGIDFGLESFNTRTNSDFKELGSAREEWERLPLVLRERSAIKDLRQLLASESKARRIFASRKATEELNEFFLTEDVNPIWDDFATDIIYKGERMSEVSVPGIHLPAERIGLLGADNTIEFYPPSLALMVRAPTHLHTSIVGGIIGGKFGMKAGDSRYTKEDSELLVRDLGWPVRIILKDDLRQGKALEGLFMLDEPKRLFQLTEAFAERMMRRNSGRHLIFSPPRFEQNHRLFGDLTLYAPGLHTRLADIQATLEHEAKQDKPIALGKIDKEARRLIDGVRSSGWETVTIDTEQPFQVTYNGAGHFQYQRFVTAGLREEVVADGDALWHLYPEIGLAGRRFASRRYFSEIGNLVPWLLPPAEDLARSADVALVKENVVAIIPRTAKKEKSDTTIQLHLVFDKDRLTERRIVEMPTGRTLARETYDAEGVVEVRDEGDRVVSRRRMGRVAASAPDLTPDVDKLLVIRFPVRSSHYLYEFAKTHRNSASKMSKALAEDLFVAHCFGHDGWHAQGIFAERFDSKGDHRLGFFTLLNAVNATLNPSANFHGGVKATFDVKAQHPDSPAAMYLAHNQLLMLRHKPAPYLGTLPGSKSSFLNRLARYRDLTTMWSTGQASAVPEALKTNMDDTIRGLRDCELLPWAWSVIDAVRQSGRSTTEFQLALGQVQKDLGESTGLIYSGRYQHASSLYSSGKQREASKLFVALYEDAFRQGVLPPLDGTFREALNFGAEAGTQPYAQFLRSKVRLLLKEHRPQAAILLAWQTRQMGDSALASEFFLEAINGVPREEQNLVRLAGLEYLWHTSQFAFADALLDQILEDQEFAQSASLWRLSARLADRRGLLAKAISATEKVMELEYRDLPEIINLEAVRQQYRGLLNQYQQLAAAFTLTKSEAPKDLIAKVVKTADRWRSLDPENIELQGSTARILRHLGAHDLAWDYLTTPIGMKPGEAEPWVQLAQSLREEAQFELADRAYAAAFRAEPTNAQILWDQAQTLQMMGEVARARTLFAHIADGTWQPRFAWIQNQAKAMR